MAEREITGTRKRSDGKILSVCHQGESWSPRVTKDVIADIESGTHSYYVTRGIRRVPLIVVNDRRAGKYLRTEPDQLGSNNLYALPGCGPNAGTDPSPQVLRVRRDITTVGPGERARLRDAIIELNNRHYDRDPVSWWGKQDQIHQSTHVHGGPQFLPWHRELINRFEALLQQVDPDVVLHYWDWQTDPRGGRVDLFTSAFMGSPSGDIGPPFTYMAGVTRDLPPQAPRDYRFDDPNTNRTYYLSSDQDAIAKSEYPAMRRALEFVHNWAHGYIGGTLRTMHSSFKDPFVFLLHSNLDRLWASWQLQARGDSRLALARLDPGSVYGDERDLQTVQDPGDSTVYQGIPRDLQPWAGRGAPPVAPWGGPLQSQPPDIKTSRHPSVVRPPLYDRYVWPLGCSWPALLLGHELPDGDIIRATITERAVDEKTIQFVLETDTGITWWKGLRVPDGLDNSWMIETQDRKRSDSTFLMADQVHNGQQLIFHKAKFAGAHRVVYRLGDLDRLQPGSSVTFRWVKD